jgi:hypothetical protein
MLQSCVERVQHYMKMDLREVGWGGMDWIALAEDRGSWRALLNAVTKLRVQFLDYLNSC